MDLGEPDRFSFTSLNRKGFVFAESECRQQIERILVSLSIPISAQTEETFSLSDSSQLVVFGLDLAHRPKRLALTRSLKRIQNPDALVVIYSSERILRIDEILFFHALGVSFIACGSSRDDDLKKFLKAQLQSHRHQVLGMEGLKIEIEEAIATGDRSELHRLYIELKKQGKKLNFDLLFEKYRLNLALGSHFKALFYLRQILAADCQNTMALSCLARLFFESGNGHKAALELARIEAFGFCIDTPRLVTLEEHPFLELRDRKIEESVAQVLGVLGQISLSRERWQEAEFYFLSLLLTRKLDPEERSSALFGYGLCCLRTERKSEAKELFQSCLTLKGCRSCESKLQLKSLSKVVSSNGFVPQELNIDFCGQEDPREP